VTVEKMMYKSSACGPEKEMRYTSDPQASLIREKEYEPPRSICKKMKHPRVVEDNIAVPASNARNRVL
jgi:hypothetical protein